MLEALYRDLIRAVVGWSVVIGVPLVALFVWLVWGFVAWLLPTSN